jgi:hypothetical protein
MNQCLERKRFIVSPRNTQGAGGAKGHNASSIEAGLTFIRQKACRTGRHPLSPKIIARRG